MSRKLHEFLNSGTRQFCGPAQRNAAFAEQLQTPGDPLPVGAEARARDRLDLVFDNAKRNVVRCCNMTATATKIEQELRRLPMEDLLAIHDLLVVSIHEREETKRLDPAFREEVRRRVEEIDSGKTTGAEAFETLKKM